MKYKFRRVGVVGNLCCVLVFFSFYFVRGIYRGLRVVELGIGFFIYVIFFSFYIVFVKWVFFIFILLGRKLSFRKVNN